MQFSEEISEASEPLQREKNQIIDVLEQDEFEISVNNEVAQQNPNTQTIEEQQAQQQNQQTEDLSKNDKVSECYPQKQNDQQDVLNFENLKKLVHRLERQTNEENKSELAYTLVQNIEKIKDNLIKLVTEFNELKSSQNPKKIQQKQSNFQLDQLIKELKDQLKSKETIQASLRKKLQVLEQENCLLLQIKDEQEKTIMQIDEEMKLICKFTQLDEKKNRKFKRKLSFKRDSFKRERQDSIRETNKGDDSNKNCEKSGLDRILEEEEEDQAFNLAQRDPNIRHSLQDGEESERSGSYKNIFGPPSHSHFFEGQQVNYDDKILNEDCLENDDQDEQFEGKVDKEIQALKTTMSKRHSQISMQIHEESEESSYLQTELETVEPLNTHTQLVNLKKMIAKKRVNHSMRASSLLFKLDDNRNSSYQYQTQMEEDIACLQSKLKHCKEEHQAQVRELNQRIDDLLTKFQETEEEKIRYEHKLEQNIGNNEKRQEQLKKISLQIKQLEEEKEEILDLLNQANAEIEEKSKMIVSLEAKLKESKEKFEKIFTKNSQLIEQTRSHDARNSELQGKVSQLTYEIELKTNQYLKIESQMKLLINKNQELQSFLEENQKVIEELEEISQNTRTYQAEYTAQIQKIRTQSKKTVQKLNLVSQQLQEASEKVEKLEHEKRIMSKTQQDMKYLIQTLKKDAFRVKEIQEKQWSKWESHSNRYEQKNATQRSVIFTKQDVRSQNEFTPRMKMMSHTLKQNSPDWVQNHNVLSELSFRKNKNPSKYTERETSSRTTTSYTDLVKKKYMM